MSERAERAAILQMEFDVARFTGTKDFHGHEYAGSKETPWNRVYRIAKTAACDTITNGGTFVLVVGDGKITMVQRAEPIALEDEAPAA